MKQMRKKHSENLSNETEIIEISLFDEDTKELLESYLIEMPNEDEIHKSIQLIKTYTPKEKKGTQIKFNYYKKLLKNCTQEALNFSYSFWLTNLLLFILGFLSITVYEANPYITGMVLSPIPILIGLIEIFRNKDEGVIELESTFKHNMYEIIISKILIISFYNVTLLTLLAIVLESYENINLFNIILTWYVPMAVNLAIALKIAKRTKVNVTSSVLISLWICLAIMLEQIFEKTMVITNIYKISFLVLGIIALLFIISEIRNLKNTLKIIEV